MNKIYKSIYNEVLGTWVAISEVAKAGGKKSKSKMLSSVILGMVLGTAGIAGDVWGYVSNGSNVAKGEDSTSVGEHNNVDGNKSTGIGNYNYVKGVDGIASGTSNVIKQSQSGSLGSWNFNEGVQSFTYGFLNYALGDNGIALGSKNYAVGNNSTVLGLESYSGDISKFVYNKTKKIDSYSDLQRLGSLISSLKTSYNIDSVPTAKNGLALGFYSFAFNNYSLALGNSTISSGDKSIALGNAAVSLNNNDIAIGTNALAGFSNLRVDSIRYGTENYNLVDNLLTNKYGRFSDVKIASRERLDGTRVEAMEMIAKALENPSPELMGASSQIAIGEDTVAMGRQVLAVGATNRAFGRNSSAVGKGNFAHGDAAQAFGNWNISIGSNAVSVGNRNDATGIKSISAGFENRSYGNYSTAIGYQNISTSIHSSAVGHSNNVNAKFANAFGYKNIVSSMGSTSVGVLNSVNGISSIAFGVGNEIAGPYSIAIGTGTITEDINNSLVNSRTNVTGSHSISIGNHNLIDSDQIVAIGNSIESSLVSNSVILGNNSRGAVVTEIPTSLKVAFGGVSGGIEINNNWVGRSSLANGSISVGSQGKERQIKHVATGSISETSTDAINGSQLFSSIQAIGNVPIKFKTDGIGELSRNLGHKITFRGGANTLSLTENNIGVNISNEGIDIKLARDIQAIESISTVDGTKLSDFGLDITDGPKIIKEGINVNNKKIVNLQTGINETDAANIKNVTDSVNELKNLGYTLEGDNNSRNKFQIGSSILFNGDKNITTLVGSNGISLELNKNITGVSRIAFEENASITSSELKFNDKVKFGINGLTVGNGINLNGNGLNIGEITIDPSTNRLSGLEKPINDNDAVNLAFLNEKFLSVPPGSFFIDANIGGKVNFSLGGTLKISGLAEYSETDSGANISTKLDGNSVIIGLKKSLSQLDSVALSNGTKLNNDGLLINDGPSLTTNGIDANDKVITNVRVGSNEYDATNVKFVKEEVKKLVDLGYKFKGDKEKEINFPIGSTIKFIGDKNINSSLDNEGINITLNTTLRGIDNVEFKDGTSISGDGLYFINGNKVGLNQIKLGSLNLDSSGFISGLSEPTEQDQAVNKKYVDFALKNTVSSLTIDGIKYSANDGGDFTLQLGEKLSVEGKDSNFIDTDLGLNISTKSEAGKIIIGLKKSLVGLESAEIGSNILNDEGLKILGGPSITKSGIYANNKIIQNVAYGSADNDASNVRFVKDKIQALKEEGYILKADEGEGKKFAIGTSVVFYGDKNITSEVTSEGFKTKLNSSLTDIESIEIKDGPLLNSEGLSFDEKTKFTKELVKVGSVQITSDGKISGIQTPTEDNHATNKGYVDGQIAMVKNNLSTLQDSPLNFATNIGDTPKKLGETVSIKGDDSNNNANKNEFDSSNVMTWIDDKGILRIGVRKDIKLSKIKAEDASSGQSSELTPNSLVFNGVDNKSGEDGKITLDVTTNGEADVTGKTAPRLQINGVDFATLNDGMKYVANSGQPQNVKLNNTITVKGAEKNTDVTLFDGGENVMTTIEQDGKGVKYTVAFKKVPEFAGLTVGGMLANEKSPNIILKSLDGEEKFSATVDEEGAGIVTVTGNDSELKTDLMHDGLTINDVDGFSKLGTSTEGMGSLSTPDKTKRRLTHSYNIGSEEVVDEELATLNDGLKIEANIADGSGHASLNTKVKIVGSDKNRTWEEFDSGYNIMTKIEKTEDGETVIRVALRNDLNVKSGSFGGSGTDGFLNIKNEHGKEGITITPSEIRFNNTKKLLSKDHNQQDEVSMGITMTHSGSPNLLSGESVTRIQITDNSGTPTAEVATMNDGLRFKGDTEDVLEKPLSNTLTIIGGESDASKLTALEDKNIGVIAHNLSANDTKISSEKVLTVRMSRNLKGLHSAEFKTLDESGNASGKSIRIDDAGVTIAKGEKGVQLSEEGLTIGEKGPSITNNGINAGGMSISNVGIPTEAHHASSKGYVDRELANVQGQLGSKIQEARKDSLGGAAMAMATAGLPQAYKPGKSAFAVSGGVVAGQSAFAMGLSTISEDGKWIIKGSVSSDSRSQVGGSIGAAYQW
ncbi:ESPR-type extended signal peptide-containing protein [Taylorella equigenitalis]|uniref:Hemagglutinin/invasin n=1 Tax=Taylorella equigenitalis ATCC 35865 TaxID=743973 RepID=A0ABM5N952_9BURK|nr:YadA-like family protein [Taylorella equigenitalis]AFN35447.1 hemagglutinin/invasin [Taylorella equigenitalis ATCC 35865]ASY38875.1 hypothetical protein CA604_01750 [Taylorella equigenitalis]VEG30482.1 Hep_Hag [Taylorella equigenitalis ATCC 35865]